MGRAVRIKPFAVPVPVDRHDDNPNLMLIIVVGFGCMFLFLLVLLAIFQPSYLGISGYRGYYGGPTTYIGYDPYCGGAMMGAAMVGGGMMGANMAYGGMDCNM